jgi:high affinity sulfate transporter 1
MVSSMQNDNPVSRSRIPFSGRSIAVWMPGLKLLRSYRKEWLGHDFAAGLALAAVLVPVGIAYAVAAGLPGIYGLYATILPLFAYAVFGPSRILVMSPDSALAAVILAVVLPFSAGDPDKAITLAAAMALVTGVACIVIGLARLGFVTELLSKPIRYGYMNGIALTVLLSQLPALFGFRVEGSHVPTRVMEFLSGLAEGATVWPALAVGVGCLAVMTLITLHTRLPAMLIGVVLAILAVVAFGLEDRIHVLGPLPQGLPRLVFPLISSDELGAVVAGGMAAAVLAFAETSVLSRSYAAHLGEHVDANREAVALGMANLAAGLFQGFPVSSSASRTPVVESAGGKTQLACVVGALAVVGLLVFAPGLLRHLPDSALAAVVILAASRLFVLRDLLRIYRVQQWEFWLSMVCCIGVVMLGPIPGIGLAIVIAVIEFLWDGWRPHFAVLGRVDRLKGYHDLKRYPHARQVPGLVLFRWDAPLFFANSEWFSRSVMDAVENAPQPVSWLVVAAEPVTSVDITAADMLAELDDQLRRIGVRLCFAEMKDPVLDKLKRFGLYERFENHFFPTIGVAVSSYLDTHDVEWNDWEEASSA